MRLLYDFAALSPAGVGNSTQMKRKSIPAPPLPAILACLAVAALVLGSTACVYRPNIQQGNLLEVKDVDQVTVGMTRSQVRYVLGTPMVSDPFSPDRWDYIYTLKRGRERGQDRSHFVVHFSGDTVTRVEKLDLPELTDQQKNAGKTKKKHWWQRNKDVATREPPPAPSIRQGQASDPRPGGSP
jgi:outer membrane protein assembly factor BamE